MLFGGSLPPAALVEARMFSCLCSPAATCWTGQAATSVEPAVRTAMPPEHCSAALQVCCEHHRVIAAGAGMLPADLRAVVGDAAGAAAADLANVTAILDGSGAQLHEAGNDV